MPIALSPDDTFEYTLKRDRDLPEKEQRRFTLKVLSRAEERKLTNIGLNSKGELTDPMARIDAGLTIGLRGWNATDVEGKPREFVMPEALDCIGPYDRGELYRALETRGEAGVLDIKSN